MTAINHGGASPNNVVKHDVLDVLGYKSPKIIDSFTYGINNKYPGEFEAVEKSKATGYVYYDPMKSGIFGDPKICSTIKNPNYCT